MAKPLVTARDIELAAQCGGILYVDGAYVLSPGAGDRLLKLGVKIEERRRPSSGKMRVAIASDHGGFELKGVLKSHLESLEYAVFDFGTHSKDSCDYPDFAAKASRAVADGTCERGIVIDGAGIGSCMVANKIPGVRAAKCDSLFDILNSRAHNNANVLTLGVKHPLEEVKNWTHQWLDADFEGGRHERRVKKIDELDQVGQR
jgi:ribose 5-phosphate isomerase B